MEQYKNRWFLFIIGILSYSGSDVIYNGPVSPALSEQPVTGERQVCFCSALHKQVKICFIRLSFEFVLIIKVL